MEVVACLFGNTWLGEHTIFGDVNHQVLPPAASHTTVFNVESQGALLHPELFMYRHGLASDGL
jgi:hypothetical protein